jgi:hypothetical protein
VKGLVGSITVIVPVAQLKENVEHTEEMLLHWLIACARVNPVKIQALSPHDTKGVPLVPGRTP